MAGQGRPKTGGRQKGTLNKTSALLKDAISEAADTAGGKAGLGGTRPQTEMMVTYIDDNKEKYGVESICKVLPIAPSTYYDHKTKQHEPDKRSTRVKRDDVLNVEIRRVWEENFCVYGVRKVWHQLKREGKSSRVD